MTSDNSGNDNGSSKESSNKPEENSGESEDKSGESEAGSKNEASREETAGDQASDDTTSNNRIGLVVLFVLLASAYLLWNPGGTSKQKLLVSKGKNTRRSATSNTPRKPEVENTESSQTGDEPQQKIPFKIANKKRKGLVKPTSLAYSPKGDMLVVTGTKGSVQVFNTAGENSDEAVQVFEAHSASISAIAWSPTGGLVATAGIDGLINFWDTSNWQPTHQVISGNALSIGFSSDGSLFAYGTEEGLLKVISVEGWGPVHSDSAHQSELKALDFSPNGSYLATGGEDGLIKIWQVSGDKEVSGDKKALTISLHKEIKAYTGGVTSLDFSPDSLMLASGSKSKGERFVSDAKSGTVGVNIVGVTRLMNEQELQEYQEKTQDYMRFGRLWGEPPKQPRPRYRSAAIPRGGTIDDLKVVIWEVSSGGKLREMGLHPGMIMSVQFSPDGNYVASGVFGGKIYLWDHSADVIAKMFSPTLLSTATLAFSPDGQSLASVGSSKNIDIFETGL